MGLRFLFLSILILLSNLHAKAGTNIIGGLRVSEDDPVAKVTVSVLLKNGKLCTGTIVTDTLIMTAAHCLLDKREKLVEAKDINIGFGLSSRQLAHSRRAEAYLMPEAFEGNGNQDIEDTSDIALIKLEDKIPAGYQPAKVEKLSRRLNRKDTLTFAGYGTIDPVDDIGSGSLRKVQLQFHRHSWKETEFIAETPGKDTCRGDSGGPVFLESNGELILIGVTSRGACYGTGHYTYIQNVQEWIHQAIVNLSPETPCLFKDN